MIPVYQPFLGAREKEYVNQCLDTTWISSRGEFIGRFEQGFATYIGAPHATTVSNGTTALHLAIAALGLGPGDEVIVPTLTYVASVNAVLQAGAKVVYADSLPDTWNLDPADVRQKITPRTKAIMPVHLYGLSCDMEPLAALCHEHGLMMIEDCAEAFGSRYKGQHVGTFGDAATFSFFGNKTITTGEGGMVVMRDQAAHERAAHFKNQGVSKDREYWHNALAYNYRMTNIQAAIGLAQLERIDDILTRKRMIAQRYRERLQRLPLTFQPEAKDCYHSYWMVSLLTQTPQLREDLRAHLKAADIETRPLFYPCHTLPHCTADGAFPVANDLSARGLNLPSFPALTTDQQETVCAAIHDFYAKKGLL